MPRRQAVFLDRDGTLNRVFDRDGVSVPPAGVDQLEVLPGVVAALPQLKSSGLVLIVVTNQPDVARGRTRREVVEAVNALLQQRLSLDAVYCCYHDDVDQCGCRKPLPGMLIDAARDFNVDLPTSYLVGDSWRDIGAGLAVGCTTVLVDGHLPRGEGTRPHYRARDLAAASGIILQHWEGAREIVRR